MVSITTYALTIVIVSSIVGSAFAIHCYHCESTLDSRCGEDFQSNELFNADCDRLQQQRPQPTRTFGPFIIANATGCVKRVLSYESGKPHIQRTCYYGDIRRPGDCLRDPNNPSQLALSCNVCQEDMCNGSITLKSMGLGVVLFVILARAFF